MKARFMNAEARDRIVEAIRAAESATSGEIRVHVQAHCSDDPVRDARRVFERLGMAATAAHNGVLFFLAWRDRRFAVIGDRGIDERVPRGFWNSTVATMQTKFRTGDFVGGLEDGIRAAGEALKTYFPHEPDDVDELSDEISEN